MSDGNISKVGGSPYLPPSAARKAADKTAKQKTPSLPQDVVELSGATPQEAPPAEPASSGVSGDDMARYLKLLGEEPDIREDRVEEVKQKLADGAYGLEALEGTLDGLMEDLGL